MLYRRNSDESNLLEEQSETDTRSMAFEIASKNRDLDTEPRRRTNDNAAHGEEKMSLFWRVFGGTILSIIALSLLTVYNNLNATINDLRNEVSRDKEARSELVKKEEFNSRTQSVWNKLQELQELRGTITAMRDQMSLMAENRTDMKTMLERFSVVEQRLKSSEEQQKSLAQSMTMIAALEQKITVRDTQSKAFEDDRRELSRQIQELRERLARIEVLRDQTLNQKIPASKN